MIMKKLSAEECAQIENFISDYAFYDSSSNPRRAGLQKILAPWVDAKSNYLYRMFGEQLILTKDISYSMGVEELADEICSEVIGYNRSGSTFIKEFNHLVEWGGRYEHNYDLSGLVDSYTLAKNIYEGENFTIVLPDNTKFQVNKGCKVSKVLGKLAKALDLQGYEEFRIAHSQVLNQKMLKGKLCISIHPLDYMTMSVNECGWNSCMDWTDEGEYRRGTVAMMNSSSVVVAYLCSEHDMQLRGGKWSNKKWRQLFVVNKDIITGVKPYPYFNENLEKCVSDWLKELAESTLGFNYHKDYVAYDHGCTTTIPCLDHPVRITFHAEVMYNDFGTIGHHGYVNPDIPRDYQFTYSGPCNCMCCGEITRDFDGEHDLVCGTCESYCRCYDCGERHAEEDMYCLDGEYYCEYCYSSVVATCELCNETHHNNNTYNLHLARRDSEGKYEILRDCSIDICYECQQKLNESKFLAGKVHEYEYYWSNYMFVIAEECSKEMLDMFGFDSCEEVRDYVSFNSIQTNLN